MLISLDPMIPPVRRPPTCPSAAVVGVSAIAAFGASFERGAGADDPVKAVRDERVVRRDDGATVGSVTEPVPSSERGALGTLTAADGGGWFVSRWKCRYQGKWQQSKKSQLTRPTETTPLHVCERTGGS